MTALGHLCLALLAYAQVGYAGVLALLTARADPHGRKFPPTLRRHGRKFPPTLRRHGRKFPPTLRRHGRKFPPTLRPAREAGGSVRDLPAVSLVIAAYREQDVIAAKVADALALDYPRDRLEIVVAVDGAVDETAARAREAGADVVLELPRGGKVAAQDAAVRRTRAEVMAFSDANSSWAPDALRALVAPFDDPRVGYACGRVSFTNPEGGTNQEGLYWRYELWLRDRESALHSVTAGNGAIYAVRREAYVEVDPVMGHDLKLPTTLVRDGWRCVSAPDARATERMVPTIEGEFARKRRMMSHAWPILVRGGLFDPRGLPAPYVLALVSHRWLRYLSPFLHIGALLGTRGRVRAAQLAVLALAAAGPRAGRAGLVARYYALTTASIAAGLLDWLRHGTPAGWEPPEGTRG